ncbi:MAG: hypothetical protein OIN90_09395 [Candidatus Methanoperedens sp.]|uniref:hypothetical protein n=1 Tax=Candidatus Methanoperedens sp. BLZ2 TaxID=2035255 RepID=UPI001141E0B4|nr:hypothetical protein [Candidatus Methanoperedens sp. BLZ2]KAB2945722.1 MAG: hypothetical protein F9K14_09605 [Candidatus Methanoperedens sp.]MCX9087760.1 hypothetical protein [Candidatus Methanoperedens sp.]
MKKQKKRVVYEVPVRFVMGEIIHPASTGNPNKSTPQPLEESRIHKKRCYMGFSHSARATEPRIARRHGKISFEII